MGVKTSSQLFQRATGAGIVHSGPKPMVKDNPKAIHSYRFPTPVQGESKVFLNIGEVKENGSPMVTKIKLVDGSFIIPENWESAKKLAYRDAFLKAGFEEVCYLKGEKPEVKVVEENYVYFAGHPDNKDDEKVNGKISIKLNRKKIDLEVIEGVITTEDKEIFEALLKKGYYEAKPAQKLE